MAELDDEQWQVRPACVQDITELVRLKAVIMLTAYPFDVDLDEHPDWPDRAGAAIRDMMARGDHGFFVVDDPDRPGRLAGCVSASLLRYVPGPTWGPVHAYIGDMCTDTRFRGIGLGRLLMDAALEWCRTKGAQSVRLDATPDAVPVYEKLGFEGRSGDELFPTMMRWL